MSKATPHPSLVFLKLGGSLLGDKRRRTSFRRTVVKRLGKEIKSALDASPGMRLLLAHGGGGWAHHPARKYRTRDGIRGGGGWQGVHETRRGVMEMNRRVLDCLAESGLFPILIPPCAGVVAADGAVTNWPLGVIRETLAHGQIPLIHGDVVLDSEKGFTILSTEELFDHLVPQLRPSRVVLACDVEGVYLGAVARHTRNEIVPVIDRSNIAGIRKTLAASARSAKQSKINDVTGGMAAKVERLFELVARRRRLQARIVSGLKPGVVQAALLGEEVGTAIRGTLS